MSAVRLYLNAGVTLGPGGLSAGRAEVDVRAVCLRAFRVVPIASTRFSIMQRENRPEMSLSRSGETETGKREGSGSKGAPVLFDVRH